MARSKFAAGYFENERGARTEHAGHQAGSVQFGELASSFDTGTPLDPHYPSPAVLWSAATRSRLNAALPKRSGYKEPAVMNSGLTSPLSLASCITLRRASADEAAPKT